MILRKWNYKTHEYDHYEVSDDWNVSIFEAGLYTDGDKYCAWAERKEE